MGIIRKSDTVDLRARVLKWKARAANPRTRRQSIGVPIVTRPWWLDAYVYNRSIRQFDPKGEKALDKARRNLVRSLHGRSRPSLKARRQLQYLERHTAANGALFPQRPDFFFKMEEQEATTVNGSEDEVVQDGNQRLVVRTGKRSSRAKDAPGMLWRRNAVKKLKERARTPQFEEEGERLGWVGLFQLRK